MIRALHVFHAMLTNLTMSDANFENGVAINCSRAAEAVRAKF